MQFPSSSDTRNKHEMQVIHFNMCILIYTNVLLNFRLKVCCETTLHKFVSKLFLNLGPPYANNRLPYVPMLGIGW